MREEAIGMTMTFVFVFVIRVEIFDWKECSDEIVLWRVHYDVPVPNILLSYTFGILNEPFTVGYKWQSVLLYPVEFRISTSIFVISQHMVDIFDDYPWMSVNGKMCQSTSTSVFSLRVFLA